MNFPSTLKIKLPLVTKETCLKPAVTAMAHPRCIYIDWAAYKLAVSSIDFSEV